MGKLSLKDKVFILTSWALMLMSGAAEQDYFPQTSNLTWEEARSHCQTCFEDLVTLTPENTRSIAVNLTSDYWVGLRATSNSIKSWSRWANGDPLAFQNWYPGWPVLKPPSPESVCCSCSCTCPSRSVAYLSALSGVPSTISSTDLSMLNLTDQTATDQTATDQTATDQTATDPTATDQTATDPMASGQTATDPTATDQTATDQTATDQTATDQTATDQTATDQTASAQTATDPMTSAQTLAAQCVRSPLPTPTPSKADPDYIKDACVAMLSFGAWVEKKCSEPLPFICYEVRFIGGVNASDVTTGSAVLTWERGPGSISHYRLEVKGDRDWKENQTGLTATLGNLTAGTRYSVEVFPVKCHRDLNPQTVVFYTIPNKAENLKAINRTESSVTLSWDKPAGRVDFYVVNVNGQWKQKVTANSTEVSKLTPGGHYTFSILSAVDDETTMSDESNIEVYTKPGTVSNLTVSENSNTSLKLSWDPPSGNYTDFRVKATNGSSAELYDDVTTQTEVRVTNLPVGSKITLSVTARANHSLEGNSMPFVGHTTPGPISNLNLVPTNDSINATWNFPRDTFSSFNVTLLLDGKKVETRQTEKTTELFTGLKNAANYTVIVRIRNGELEGPAVSKSNYTLPAPPRNLELDSAGKKHITFKWEPPINASTVKYSVKLSSQFWGHSFSATVDKLYHKFDGLTSGTRYEFEVQTVVGGRSSPSEKLSKCTEAEKREISLTMLCSSAEVLLCDNATTRERVFAQLNAHFHSKLQENIFWELKKPN